MYHPTKLLAIAAAALMLAGCASVKQVPSSITSGFPAVDQGGKVAVVAHRGFWNSEQGGMSENSIASLKAAQDNGFWGSECDVHITADGIVLVNHNDDIEGKLIETHNYADFVSDLLPNGERRPTLDEYLDQAAKSCGTKLIIEFKKHKQQDREDLMVEKTVEALKAHGLYDPDRVLFISFSRHICDIVAAGHPQFINQFLSANVVKNEAPALYAKRGINGIDYYYPMFSAHPDWVKQAHELGMSVNAWTVNDEKDMVKMISLGVDAITTNFPLLARELLGERELRK